MTVPLASDASPGSGGVLAVAGLAAQAAPCGRLPSAALPRAARLTRSFCRGCVRFLLQGLKINNVFSIELVFKAFDVSVQDVKPTDMLRHLLRERLQNQDWSVDALPQVGGGGCIRRAVAACMGTVVGARAHPHTCTGTCRPSRETADK